MHCSKKIPFWTYAILLGFIANCHILGFIASFALFLFLLMDKWMDKDLRGKKILVFALIYIVFIVFAFKISMPPSNHMLRIGFGDKIFSASQWAKAIMGIERGYFPIPDFTQFQSWNTYLFAQYFPKPLRVLLLLGTFGGFIGLLYKNKKALFLFLIGTMGNLVFVVFFPFYGTRYYGFFFLFFLVAFWLRKHQENQIKDQFLTYNNSLVKDVFLVCVLSVQIVASISMFVWDWKHPFSQAENAVLYIQNNSADDVLILVDNIKVGPLISGYLQEPVYYLAEDRVGGFFYWLSEATIEGTSELVQQIGISRKQFPNKRLWLVTNYEVQFTDEETQQLNIKYHPSYEGSLYNTHDCFIYEL